jgi:hypothetical protein
LDDGVPPTLLEDAASYFWYADRFGWTPAQVDAMPAWLDSHLPTVAGAYDELRQQMQEEQQGG